MAKATQYEKGFSDGIQAIKKFLKSEALRLHDLRKISGPQMTALVGACTFLDNADIPKPKTTTAKTMVVEPILTHPQRD